MTRCETSVKNLAGIKPESGIFSYSFQYVLDSESCCFVYVCHFHLGMFGPELGEVTSSISPRPLSLYQPGRSEQRELATILSASGHTYIRLILWQKTSLFFADSITSTQIFAYTVRPGEISIRKYQGRENQSSCDLHLHTRLYFLLRRRI